MARSPRLPRDCGVRQSRGVALAATATLVAMLAFAPWSNSTWAQSNDTSAQRLQWTAPSLPGSRDASDAGARNLPPLIAELPPVMPSLAPPNGAANDLPSFPPSSAPRAPLDGSPAYEPNAAPGAAAAPARTFPEMARTPAEFPTHLPQDDYPALPPNLPDAVEDDDMMVVGPKMSAYKSGFFQKLSLSGTWLPGTPEDGLGIVESEAFLTVALPAPKKEWPLLITPYLNIRSLDGPVSPDLPPLLYETYVDFLWVPKFTPRWMGILAVAPSVYSSFQDGVEDGFRWTGKGLLRYEAIPETLHFMAGVLFLNRDDIRLLPAGGVLWRPNADIDYEIVFPRPKLAHRIRFTDQWADWWYVAGEFGGNSFAIVRADGSPDQATLRDIRVMFGLERRRDGGAGSRFEIGYVFSRSVEYRSDTPDYHPDDTLLLRFTAMW